MSMCPVHVLKDLGLLLEPPRTSIDRYYGILVGAAEHCVILLDSPRHKIVLACEGRPWPLRYRVRKQLVQRSQRFEDAASYFYIDLRDYGWKVE